MNVLTVMKKTEAKELNADSSESLEKARTKGKEDFEKELNESIKKANDNGKIFANLTDNTGRTPVMWICYGNYNNIDTTLNTEAFRLPYLEMVMAEPGFEINQKDQDGWTALHWAAWSGFDALCEVLIKAGADINQAENNGYTPLMLAAMRGNAPTVELLLNDGAQIDVINVDKKNAHALAVEGLAAYESNFESTKTHITKAKAKDFKQAVLTHISVEAAPQINDLLEKQFARKTHVNVSYELPRLFLAINKAKKGEPAITPEQEKELTGKITKDLKRDDSNEKRDLITKAKDWVTMKDMTPPSFEKMDIRQQAYNRTVDLLKVTFQHSGKVIPHPNE